MDFKTFEVRDDETFIPVLAIRVSGEDGWLFRRAGFGDREHVMLTHLGRMETRANPHEWNGCRTMTNAHMHIARNWDELKDESVVDARVVLGEKRYPAESERDPSKASDELKADRGRK